MTATDLMAEMDRQGFRDEAVGNALRLHGFQAPSADLHQAIADHKAVLIRVAAFPQQIREHREAGHPGAPFVFEVGEGNACLSCGDPCVPDLVARCGPCIEAAWVAIKAEAA